ncbi:MAG: phosphatidate cytidylyltransferase [Clostridia bacterium]|nr:phosphatidate cytidylyltransferase [Clostridia bacterium]
MTRFLTGFVCGLIMIPVCIFSHTIIWPLFWTLVSVIAVLEMLRCLGFSKEKAFLVPSVLVAFLPFLLWLFTVRLGSMDLFRCLFLFCGLYFVTVQLTSIFLDNRIPTERVYGLIAQILYVSVSFSAICLIRYLDDGNEIGKYVYLLVFFGAWISDIFAYFTGRAIGKHKLCPAISPKKTVEGSIGGVIANMIFFAGYALVLRAFFQVNASILFFAILGALLSVVGQFGDLFASAIKRHHQIKDYGKIFPGHGGVMDRFDSTLAIGLSFLLVIAAFGSGFLIA